MANSSDVGIDPPPLPLDSSDRHPISYHGLSKLEGHVPLLAAWVDVIGPSSIRLEWISKLESELGPKLDLDCHPGLGI